MAKLNLSDGTDLWSTDVSSIKHQERRWNDRKNSKLNEDRRKRLWQQAIDRPLNWVLRTDTPPTGPLTFSQPPLMLGDACDLDGDTNDDIVITARDESALAAISGIDGSVIWAARYHFPNDVDPPVEHTDPRPGFASITRVADTNDDGVDDLLCQPMRFINPRDAFHGTALVSGKTGEVLWSMINTTCNVAKPATDQNRNGPLAKMDWTQRVRRNSNAFHTGRKSSSIIHLNRPHASLNKASVVTMPMPPIVVSHASPRELILFEQADPRSTSPDDLLISESMYETRTIELASGTEVDKPSLFVDCATTSRPVKIGNDANRARLFVGSPRLAVGSSMPDKEFPPIELKLLDVVSGKVLWNKDIYADWYFRDLPSAPTWPLIVDFDGDGTDEIVVPDNDAYWEDVDQASLKIFNGATGELHSTTESIFTALPQIDFMIDTIDIDGDGVRDLITATLFRAFGLDTCGDLHFDAFSAADGNHLWHYELDAFESRVFDHVITGISSESSKSGEWIEVQLEQPPDYRNMERSRTLALDPRSGEVISDLVGLTPITPAADADVPRLFLEDFDARSQSVHNRLLVTTQVNRGSWTMLGGSGMVAIERGGNFDDWVLSKTIKGSSSSVLTCMNQNGETIWTKACSIRGTPTMIHQLKVWPDRPTLFMATPTPNTDGLPCLIDASTGKEIWRIRNAKRVPARPIQVDSRDLDADGKPEIIYVAVQFNDDKNLQSRPTDSATIYCIGGATGKVLWEREVLSGIPSLQMPEIQDASSWSPDQGAALSALVTADFNQDGTQDVVIADTKDAGRVLSAIDGKSGGLLWQHPLVGNVDRYRNGDVPRPVVLQIANGTPMIGLTDLAEDQSGVKKSGVRITLKLIDGKDGKTLHSRDELVHKDWSRRQVHSIWHHRGRFTLHALPKTTADEATANESTIEEQVVGKVHPSQRSQRMGCLLQRPDFSQQYYVFDITDRQLKEDLSLEVFHRRKHRNDQWLQCWLEPTSSNILVTATKKQSTRYNLSNGDIVSQAGWDSSCGTLGSVEGVSSSGGRQSIVGRCSGDFTSWVSMNVDDGSMNWRLPIYRSSGGDPWGSGYRLFHRAGASPPRIALNNLYSQTVLQTIGTGQQLTEKIPTQAIVENASLQVDRRSIRNLRGSRRADTSVDMAITSMMSTIFGLGIFVIPLVYLRKLFRRQFSITYFLAAFPVVAIVLTTLGMSTPKMWSTVSSPLASLAFGLLGTTLLIALFIVVRSAMQRRWLASTLLIMFLIVANCYSVALPIVRSWTEQPRIRFNIQWTNFIEPSLIALHAFGLACMIFFVLKFLWQIAKSLLSRILKRTRSAETTLGEGQPS